MAVFTIRAAHDHRHTNEKRFIESMTHAGCYFLKHAALGCDRGDHSACLNVVAECEEDVRLIVPPVLRGRATITRIA
jgi:hypothetical protein